MTVTNIDSALIESQEDKPHSRLRPRRTLNRLALAVAGLGIAALGQMALGRDSLWEGLLLYGLAMVLFVWALAGQLYPAYTFSLFQAEVPTLHFGWRQSLGIWLVMLGLGTSILGYNFFGREEARFDAQTRRPLDERLRGTDEHRDRARQLGDELVMRAQHRRPLHQERERERVRAPAAARDAFVEQRRKLLKSRIA